MERGTADLFRFVQAGTDNVFVTASYLLPVLSAHSSL
jgi:hypothetical protein